MDWYGVTSEVAWSYYKRVDVLNDPVEGYPEASESDYPDADEDPDRIIAYSSQLMQVSLLLEDNKDSVAVVFPSKEVVYAVLGGYYADDIAFPNFMKSKDSLYGRGTLEEYISDQLEGKIFEDEEEFPPYTGEESG